jgi:hypothetical protein
MLRMLAVATYALTTLFQTAVAVALCVQTVAALNGSTPLKSVLWLLVLLPLSVPALTAVRRMFITRRVLPAILFERAPIIALLELIVFSISIVVLSRAWLSDSALRSEDVLGAFALAILLSWMMLGISEISIARLMRGRQSQRQD